MKTISIGQRAFTLAATLAIASVATADKPGHLYDANGNLVEIVGEVKSTTVYMAHDEDGNLVKSGRENGDVTEHEVVQNPPDDEKP